MLWLRPASLFGPSRSPCSRRRRPAASTPMYAEHADGSPGLRVKFMGVDLPPTDKPNGSREARIGVQIRNALAFKLYGSATGMPPTHKLVLKFSTTRASLIVDPSTQLPSSENYGIDAQFNLVEIATNKSVMTGTTFSRVTYDMPGSYQRFARSRAFRDAEDRAAQEIAENIQTGSPRILRPELKRQH